jgi:hypothetical protein
MEEPKPGSPWADRVGDEALGETTQMGDTNQIPDKLLNVFTYEMIQVGGWGGNSGVDDIYVVL